MMQRFKFLAKVAKNAAIFTVAAIIFSSVSVYAASKNAPVVLTLKDAILAATNASTQMKNYKDTAAALEKEQSSLEKQYNEATDPAVRKSLENQRLQNNSKRAVNQMNILLFEQKMEISMIRAFANVISAENALIMYDKTLKKEERELTVTKVKSSFNLVSESAYVSAVNNYEKKLNDRISRVNAVDNAYTSLNNLLNRNASVRHILELNFEYTKLGGFSLPAAISQAKDKSADIKSKSDDVSYTQLMVDQYEQDNTLSYQENADKKKALEDKNSEARRLLNDAITSLEQKVTQGYNDLLKAEAQYDSNLLELEILQKQYEINKTKFDMGKITELEFLNSQYQVEQIEETIRAQIIEHEILMKQIANPVLFTI